MEIFFSIMVQNYSFLSLINKWIYFYFKLKSSLTLTCPHEQIDTIVWIENVVEPTWNIFTLIVLSSNHILSSYKILLVTLTTFVLRNLNFHLNFKLTRKIELQSNLLKFPKSWLLHFIIINKFIYTRDHSIAKGENMEIIDKIKFDFCYFSNEIYTEILEQNLTRKWEPTAYTIYLEMNVKKKKEDKSLHDSFLPQPKLYW